MQEQLEVAHMAHIPRIGNRAAGIFAKDDWREGRFAKVPGDEDEFIPLPED